MSTRGIKPENSIDARMLFLSANANDQSPLAVDREYNRVKSALQTLGVWKQWRGAIEHTPAAEWEQVPEELLSQAASIVHFAGHGYPDGSLELSSHDGAGQRIHASGLAELFKSYAGQVRLVVLNACYSEVLAEALTKYVDVVIGMTHAISDEAAILFAPTFYQQLAGGKSVQTAFEVARAVVLGRHPELSGQQRLRDAETHEEPHRDMTPHMCVRVGVDASRMVFVPAASTDTPNGHRPRNWRLITLATSSAVLVAGIAIRVWMRHTEPKPIEMVHISGGAVGTVPVPGFWIAKTELSQEQWQSATGGNPSVLVYGDGPQYPVNNFTWDDAIQTANTLSKQHGLMPCYKRSGATWIAVAGACSGYRLVTELEWRYLKSRVAHPVSPCVTANVADRSLFAKQPDLVAQLKTTIPDYVPVDCDDGYSLLAPIESLEPDSLGLYHVEGNVAEWIWNGTGARPATRAVRGSSFLYPGLHDNLPPADALRADQRQATIGVRYARDER